MNETERKLDFTGRNVVEVSLMGREQHINPFNSVFSVG